MDWLLLERVRHNVILPAGGAGLQRTLRQKCGVKVSLDAASVRKAKKGNKHWTTLIVQVLCQGVDQGCWGRNAVAHMLEKAQSPDFIAKVRLWQGKDDHANFKAHVSPLVKQIVQLELEGFDVAELLMPLPPKLILRGEGECQDDEYVSGELDTVDDDGGVRADGLEGERAHVSVRDVAPFSARGQLDRLAVVSAVRMFPSLVVALDGGTWASASGVSVSATERNDFLTNLTRTEQRKPYEWRWLEEGDSVLRWCERKRPGDAAFRCVALMGLSQRDAPALAKLTMEKARKHTMADDEANDGGEGGGGEGGSEGGGDEGGGGDGSGGLGGGGEGGDDGGGGDGGGSEGGIGTGGDGGNGGGGDGGGDGGGGDGGGMGIVEAVGTQR
jgi:hypothetical protein